jgi:formyltetrahydrofolate hydrolase
VKRVYPYFEIAKTVVFEMEEEKTSSKRKHFKHYKKDRKQSLMNEFEKELRNLKVSEGKVLVKMINRDTGTNFYDLIKEYNGGLKAWIYNIVANKYDYDLKASYDPKKEENRMLELAIKQVLGNNQSR